MRAIANANGGSPSPPSARGSMSTLASTAWDANAICTTTSAACVARRVRGARLAGVVVMPARALLWSG